ncbi:MAG: cytochrome c biogenesis protein CcsA [Pseudomonadota bacterium]
MYMNMYVWVAIGYLVLGILASLPRWHIWSKGSTFFWFGMAIVWLLHTFALKNSIFIDHEINLDVATAFSLLVALSVGVYTIGQKGFWKISIKEMYRFWHLFLIPAACISAFPLVWQHSHFLISGGSVWMRTHWWIGLLSLAMLNVATLQAIWLAHRGKYLKTSPAEFENTPSLLSLERSLFIWIWSSFALLTITIISGTIFSEQLGYAPHWSHKVMFTLITWCLLAHLLWRRSREGVRGYVVAKQLTWSYALIILGYLGSKFVLEVLLKR